MKISFKWSLTLFFTIFSFFALSLAYFLIIKGLNTFQGEKILTTFTWSDVLAGLTIYLKTSIDFAILIGILMHAYRGYRNQVIIESSTALGNMLGTVFVLTLWYFFKEFKWLLAMMIFFASLVLLKLAYESLSHIKEGEEEKEVHKLVKTITLFLNSFLEPINKFINPLLSKIMPSMKFDTGKKLDKKGLFLSAFTIPFILGTDDFAGYVPLFNVVNVFGFGIGVFLGHMILNVFLFINPKKTIQIVKNPFIAVAGSAVFVGLSAWGFYEVLHMVLKMIEDFKPL